MLNTVWNYEFAGDSRIVDVHISHLRDKLEDNLKPQLIKTVRGLGYIWKDLRTMMKFHHRLMLLISSILIISFVTLGIIIHASITYVLSEKHEQALATDARSYIYLVQDNEIDKVKEIVKQQNIDLLITKNDKRCLVVAN